MTLPLAIILWVSIPIFILLSITFGFVLIFS
jgi:hypothetical protein